MKLTFFCINKYFESVIKMVHTSSILVPSLLKKYYKRITKFKNNSTHFQKVGSFPSMLYFFNFLFPLFLFFLPHAYIPPWFHSCILSLGLLPQFTPSQWSYFMKAWALHPLCCLLLVSPIVFCHLLALIFDYFFFPLQLPSFLSSSHKLPPLLPPPPKSTGNLSSKCRVGNSCLILTNSPQEFSQVGKFSI